MSTLIFITGTICSGKTTMAKRISESLGIGVVNETNTNGFFGIIDEIQGNAFISPVIVEHAEVYNLLNEKRKHYIGGDFDKVIVILINVADDILADNLAERKSQNAIGDYLNIDMFEMKAQIKSYFDEMNCTAKYVANINTVEDYEREFTEIVLKLQDVLR